MFSLDQMKEWVYAKGQAARNLLADLSGSNTSTHPNFGAFSMVLTPNNIPEFTIPPSLESVINNPERNQGCRDESVGYNGRENNWDGYAWHMSHRSGESQCSARALRTTNADPLSSAAMELTHFKTSKTSYGFDNLAELPHTNRRESLFFGDWNSSRFRGSSMRNSPNKISNKKVGGKDYPLFPQNRCNNIQSFQSSSPGHNPMGGDYNYLRVPALQQQESDKDLKYFRRRSSLPTLEENVPAHTEDPNHVEQSDDCDEDIRFLESCATRLKQEARSTVSGSQSFSHSTGKSDVKKERSIASSKQRNDPGMSIANFGEIKVSLQYLPSSSCLKVVLLRAENLGGAKKRTSFNTQVKLALRPGKTRKQQTKVFKGTADPVINQEFYFAVPNLEQLRQAVLQMKVFNKLGQLKKDELLGETQVPLESFDLMTENRIWRNLIPAVQEYGCLQVQCNFSPSQEKLEVKVISVSDLPKHIITGYPDAFVKVTLSQPKRQPAKGKTRVKRSLPCLVFNETFVFEISPRTEDLKYTNLTFTVYRRERLCSDEVIGQVSLGYECTQDSELLHWNRILHALDTNCQYKHKIMHQDCV